MGVNRTNSVLTTRPPCSHFVLLVSIFCDVNSVLLQFNSSRGLISTASLPCPIYILRASYVVLSIFTSFHHALTVTPSTRPHNSAFLYNCTLPRFGPWIPIRSQHPLAAPIRIVSIRRSLVFQLNRSEVALKHLNPSPPPPLRYTVYV